MKVVKHPMALAGMAQAGYPESSIVPIGLALVVAAILYAIPHTAVLGAVLLTGYLGGAVATHVHMGQGWQLWFAVGFGVLAWLGIWLRDARVRALLPMRNIGN
ncbi:MAG: hypothetical protein NVS9B15_15910 [Acidobacteriaceae bacterium]